jgi:citrate synthase
MADTLTITDNRTGKTYEVPIQDGTIRADALRQIKSGDGDFGLMTYDPAFMNTASCRSAITLIDGDVGILRYRGYPIEQLAESSTYLEVAYLLLNGELPNQSQLEKWSNEITHHTYVHEFLREGMKGFRYDAHAMGKLVSMLGTLSTFYPESKNVRDPKVRHDHIIKLIAKMPTIAAYAYRHRRGLPYVYPDNDLSYSGNFLNMLFKMTEVKYQPNPVHREGARRAVHPARRPRAELLDHRHARGRLVARGPVLGARGQLRGALRPAARRRQRGGAAHARRDRLGQQHPRLHQAREGRRGAPDGLRPPRLQELRPAREGHQEAGRPGVRRQVGKNPLVDIAVELEKIALEDEYFVKRKLYPNVDFYSGLIYQAMGLPWTCSPCSSPSAARRAGWRSGRRCSTTTSRRSRARARSTPAPTLGECIVDCTTIKDESTCKMQEYCSWFDETCDLVLA